MVLLRSGVLLAFLSVILLPLEAFAPKAAVSKTGTVTSTATLTEIPNPRIYNLLREPQFKLEPLGVPKPLTGDRSISVANGGIGNGGMDAYFCGPHDELDSYANLIGTTRRTTNNPNRNGLPSGGTYNFLQLIDQCQLILSGVDRCGEVTPLNTFSILGIPTHATNCHPWGRRYMFDDVRYQLPFIHRDDRNWTPLNTQNPDWYGRNFIDRGHTENPDAFVYGRYLVRRFVAQEPFKPDDTGPITQGMSYWITPTVPEPGFPFLSDAYNYGSQSPSTQRGFLDVPYSIPHLAWGFTCSQISKMSGYKANEPLQKYNFDSCEEWVMEGERRAYYFDLLKQARDYIGDAIAQKHYGDIYTQPLDTKERLMSEIVGNAWAALNKMLPNLHGGDCFGHMYFGFCIPSMMIELSCCPAPNGALVHYDTSNPTKPRICVRPDVCDDCQSKRGRETHPYFNVSGRDGTGRCPASYGTWREDPYKKVSGRELGLFETGNRGDYELYLAKDNTPPLGWESEAEGKGYTGDYYNESVRRTYPPRDGYGPVIVSLIAHQLVHAAYNWGLDALAFGTLKRMEGWPSPESIWEEELAVMTQALVLDALAELGHAPKKTFRMEKESYSRTLSEEYGSSPISTRFYYQDAPIGYKGIFLGSYYANMYNIAHWLKFRDDPDMSRMLALYHTLGPLFDPPTKMTINGKEKKFQMAAPSPVTLQCGYQPPDPGGTIDGTIRDGSGIDGTISPLIDGTYTGTLEPSIDTQFPVTDGVSLTDTTLNDSISTTTTDTTISTTLTTSTETTLSPTTETTISPTDSISTTTTEPSTTTESTSTWDSIVNFFGGSR